MGSVTEDDAPAEQLGARCTSHESWDRRPDGAERPDGSIGCRPGLLVGGGSGGRSAGAADGSHGTGGLARVLPWNCSIPTSSRDCLASWRPCGAHSVASPSCCHRPARHRGDALFHLRPPCRRAMPFSFGSAGPCVGPGADGGPWGRAETGGSDVRAPGDLCLGDTFRKVLSVSLMDMDVGDELILSSLLRLDLKRRPLRC